MTIQRSKDYYRTVNGKRILVHGHNYEHEAEEPSSEDFDAAFEQEFGGTPAAAPAAESKPAEPEEPSKEEFDTEFDNLFGEGEKVIPKWAQEAPEAKPAPAPQEPASSEASGSTGKITGLQPGGMGNDASSVVTEKGINVFRSKLNNGAYLFVSKNFHGGDSLGEPLPLKLKHAITAIPGASIKAMHLHGAMKYLEVPFEQAEALEKVLSDFEAGILAAPKKAPKAAAQAYESGANVPFKDLKPGMKFAYSGGQHDYEIIQKNPQSVVVKMINKETGEASSFQPKITAKHWGAGYESQLTLKGEGGESQTEHHVGETKVENGKTYVLNENHKWELAPGQEPPAKAKKASFKPEDGKFPFKKVGPQGGAQPGGVFEDEFGQKWYIKFPPSEDVCKNEVLALKFYESILGKGSVPSVKMVNAKGISDIAPDGKLGIASKWVDGLKEDHHALATGKVPNAWEGFALDAWMANWDVVGGNQSKWKNMVVGPDGKAVRVDAGGALLYKGLGGSKGGEFGDEVNEIERLRNASVNPETAHVYKGITRDQIVQSVAKVLEVPDDFIKAMVDKFGPGDEAAKTTLTQKLISRKQSLAKQFPEADLIAHPPAPDKRHLQVDPSKLPAMLDYFKMGSQGPTNTWVSSSEAINKANNQAAQDLYDLALKGDYLALKSYKAPDINKATGEVVGHVPVSEHKSSKYLVPFYNTILEHMEVLAYPASAHAKKWTVPSDVENIASLSAAFPGHEFGVTVADVPANERLGFWIQLGQVENPHRFMPPDIHNVTDPQRKKGKDDYKTFSSSLKNWLGNVQGSGSSNVGDKKSNIVQYKPIVAEAYEKATEFEAGTKIRRRMTVAPDMFKQLAASEPGIVFENPRSQCCSMNTQWETNGTHFGGGDTGILLDMVYAEGAKGMASFGSGHFFDKSESSHDEQEITSLPGQRYMLIDKGKASNGKPKYTLLVLPPDPTYIDALNG